MLNPAVISEINLDEGTEFERFQIEGCTAIARKYNELTLVAALGSNDKRVIDLASVKNAVTDVYGMKDSFLFAATENEFVVIDIWNPEKPRVVYSNPNYKSISALLIEDNLIYILDAGAGLAVYDIANPSVPKQTARYGRLAWPFSAAVSGDYVYVVDRIDRNQMICELMVLKINKQLQKKTGVIRDEPFSAAILDVETDLPDADRNSMIADCESALKEQKTRFVSNSLVKDAVFKTMSGRAGCTTSECAVQAGRAVNTSGMFIGNVYRLGEAVVFNVRLIDVSSSEIALSDSVKMKSLGEFKAKARELFGRILAKVDAGGKITAIKGNTLSINIGAEDGLRAGVYVYVMEETEAVKNNIGIKVYAEYREQGTAEVASVAGRTARAVVKKTSGKIKTGDYVKVMQK